MQKIAFGECVLGYTAFGAVGLFLEVVVHRYSGVSQGQSSEYVNPYVPTQTPKKD